MDDETTVVAGQLLSGIHNVATKIGTPVALDRQKATKATPRIMWFGVDLDCGKYAKTSSGKDLLATSHGIKSFATSLEKQIGITLMVFPERDI